MWDIKVVRRHVPESSRWRNGANAVAASHSFARKDLRSRGAKRTLEDCSLLNRFRLIATCRSSNLRQADSNK